MEFKYQSALIFLFSILSITISAQNMDYSSLSIPENLKKEANDVVRLDHTKFTVISKKEATMQIKYVATLLNSKSNKNLQYVAYDNHTKINGLSARIYDAFGNLVQEFKKNDFIDHSAVGESSIYSDSRVKYIELNNNTYPYTIELTYKITFKGLLSFPDCHIQGFNSSLENLVFIVETPTGLAFRHKARNIETRPEVNKKKETATYKWTIQNRPALKSEAFMPANEKILPMIEFSPQTFQYDKYSGDASTWQSFGKFFHNLRDGRDELSPEMATKVNELTEGLHSNEEKIEVLYRYLQENMRYVSVQLGIGGYQPFDAKYVEKNKYGDCKALSNFMLAMLKETGIKAQPGIIYRNSDTRMMMDEDFPVLFGNHMLIYIPSDDIWLECTSNHYPVNYLGASNDNRSVLLLSEDGGQLVTSPDFKSSDNAQTSSTTINIFENGSANIVNRVKTIGPKHEFYRSIENYLSTEDIEKVFRENSTLPAFKIERLKIKSQKNKPEAQIDYQINVSRFSTKAGKRLFIPLNKLNRFDEIPPPNENRIHPIEIIRGYQEFDDISFNLPKEYKLESIPEEVEIQTAYGKYNVKIEVNNSVLRYHRTLEISAVKLPSEEYKQFRDFYKEIAKADAMKIVLVKKKT